MMTNRKVERSYSKGIYDVRCANCGFTSNAHTFRYNCARRYVYSPSFAPASTAIPLFGPMTCRNRSSGSHPSRSAEV